MTIKKLKEWFMSIPGRFDDKTIETIDIDLTRNVDLLNLVTKQNGTVIIKTLHRKPSYIDED